MMNFVIIAGVVLVVAIFVVLLRVSSLMDVAKKSDDGVDMSGNRINGLLFILFLVVSGVVTIWYSIVYFDEYTIPIASEHGVVTDNLFWITMAVTGFIFILTHILLFGFSFHFQFKKTNTAAFLPHNDKLEIIWTVVPAIVLTLLVIAGLKTWTDITSKAPADAEVIEIMGYQFAWGTRYPGADGKLGRYNYRLIDAENAFGVDFSDVNALDDFIPREIHIPKGKPVLLKIRARDVLHSVFLPHFRLKMDAVPGMPTQFWFVPTKTTDEMRTETDNPEFNYELACTEICGRGHFSMRMIVVVDEPADYDKWKSEQESWLSKNPEYLSKLPVDVQELALINAGLTVNQ